MSRGLQSFRSVRALAGATLLGAAVLGCVEQAEEKPTPEDEEYIKQNLLSAPPSPQFSVNADVDGKVVYLGVDVSPNPVEVGKPVKLIHYWKVVAAPGEGWRTFTHGNGAKNVGFINADHGPVRGKYPVAQWKAGDIVRDEHSFPMPATWQTDRLEIYVGLWRRNERMPVRSGPKDDGGRVLAAVVPVKGAAPPPGPKKYLARKVARPPKIDGVLDEAAWKSAPSTGAFVDTMSGAPGAVHTEAKLLWDDKNLYIAFENADTDVWSDFKSRDDKLWQQEVVEVMIDANGDGKSYIELQVSPTNVVLDTYLPEYRKYEDSVDPKRKQFDWNSKMKTAVKVDGTVNKRGDQDKGWTVEIALPLADVNGLAQDGVKLPPALGSTWRVNMFRMDKPEKGEHAVGWSPPLVGDFHTLNRFGEVVFADEKGEIPAAAPAAPAAAAAEQPAEGADKAEKPAKLNKKAAAMNQALGGIPAGGVGETIGVEGARKSPAAAKAKKVSEAEAKK